MKKQPVGWIIDPASKSIIAIIAKDGESSDDARRRVATSHGADPTSVLDKPPGNVEDHVYEVDIPDAPEPSRAPPPKEKRLRDTELDPTASRARFRSRREASPASTAPPPVSRLFQPPPDPSQRSQGLP